MRTICTIAGLVLGSLAEPAAAQGGFLARDFGGRSGLSESVPPASNIPPSRDFEVDVDQIFVPETPPHVIARRERLDHAWQDLSEKLGRLVTRNPQPLALEEALLGIASQIEAPLRIDRKALSNQKIDLNVMVQLPNAPISAETAFAYICEPQRLHVIIDHETLLVAPDTVAETALTTRVYPVSDLVTHVQGGRGTADFTQLIQTITTVTEGPWFDVDGVGGSLSILSNGEVQVIVVRQSYKLHREIESLLYDLRAARPDREGRRKVADEPAVDQSPK